ncbi:hypothetical protein [Aquimarina latercula]|uniref:hypothetical protein n=1 Tax=Aquimarina latercula TaxID=987 RepID=UPI00041B485A|nr:hypothetical protein [Aquimarina latercula]
MGSILDNACRLNKLVVNAGLRPANGNAASSYLLYKQIERNLTQWVTDFVESLDPIHGNTTKKGFIEVQRYADVTLHKCLVKLDAITDMHRLRKYSQYESMNALIYELTGRNMQIKFKNPLKD